MKNRAEIDEELQNIELNLNSAFNPKPDKVKIKNLSLKILNLLEEIVIHLNNLNLLSPWVKSQVVDAIKSLFWSWLYAAANHLSLALRDPHKVSPKNVYREEITNLSFSEIMDHISEFKIYLQNEKKY